MSPFGKYNFHELEIGQTVHVLGKVSAIRTAASNWGSRYGIWLVVHKDKQGANVTRVDGPPTKRSAKRLDLNQRLTKLEDALRFISITVIKIQQKLEELE